MKIIKCLRQYKEMKKLYYCFREELDDCRDHAVSAEYAKKYDIDRGSYASAILEQYHQLRLKDE